MKNGSPWYGTMLSICSLCCIGVFVLAPSTRATQNPPGQAHYCCDGLVVYGTPVGNCSFTCTEASQGTYTEYRAAFDSACGSAGTTDYQVVSPAGCVYSTSELCDCILEDVQVTIDEFECVKPMCSPSMRRECYWDPTGNSQTNTYKDCHSASDLCFGGPPCT